jgi:plastocyanin
MKNNLYYVGILAATLLALNGPASFATPTNQTQLTDETIQTDDLSPEGVVAVSVGEGSNATVQHFTFTPQTIEIGAGETVTWFSPDEGTDIHTVTFVRDPSIQSDILLPFAIPAGSSATDFELLPPFTLGEPATIPGPQGREAIVAMNKIAWYPSVVDTNNQTTYLEGTDIQATLNSTVNVLNSGILFPPMPTVGAGQVDNTETGTGGAEPSVTAEISPTSLTTETTNATGSPTDALNITDDQGIPQDTESVTGEPLGPPFPLVSSFTVTFEEPGVYPYFCAIHPWMAGQVIVSGGAQTETGTQPLGNETATTTTTPPTTTPDATTPETQPPTEQTDTGTQPPPSNDTAITTTPTTTPDATTPETQDEPLSDPDADRPTPTPPSGGVESPNPLFG